SARQEPLMPRATIFELLKKDAPLVGPGIYDCLSARLAEQAGFEMVFLSGYCLSATLLGEPDFGFLTQTQVLEAAGRVCSAVNIPVIVDIDTGYGNAFNVEKTVETLLRIGAAGCFLEDQVWPKRCGHMQGKRVVPVDEYLPKLRAALAAKKGTSFHVTARTDARAAVSLEDAIYRAKIYADMGADAVFIEAPESIQEMDRIRKEVPLPTTLVANMVEQGKTPIRTVLELYRAGYKIIAVPVAGLLAQSHALKELFATLKRDGKTGAFHSRMFTFQEMNSLVRLDEKYEREKEWM
ncbi:MAG: isocitrate lyase/PEP mutase family protein, partial [Bdellovibrionota bacterium]